MQSNQANLAERLQADSPDQRAQSQDRFIADLRSNMDALMALLTGEAERTNRIDPGSADYHAIEILGFMRYTTAAELFVQRIDTRSMAFPAVSDEKQAHFPFFPYAVAAAAVGVPALPALAVGIQGADPTTTRFQLSCLVLKEILGEELALLHLTSLAKTDAPLRDAARMEQATRLIGMRTSLWDAKYCSDYAPR